MSKYSYIACIEGDTSGIVNAMKDVEEHGKDLNRRMKVINEGLKFNPESVELLGSKFDNLSEQLENAKIKFEALKSVEEQAKHSRETGNMSKDNYAYYQQQLAKAENGYKTLEIAVGTAKAQLDRAKEALEQNAYATKGLAAVLSEVETAGKSFDSELKEIDTSLRNGGGAEILGQKYNVLSQAIENTESKLDALKSAQNNMAAGAENGTVSTQQQREYQREMESTVNKLARYKQELEQVKQSLDNVNSSTESASNEAEQFANGLNEFDTRASQLKNQLDEINRSLQLNPGNSELITQKYAALGRQISNARDKLEYLNNAEKQVKAEFSSGKIGAEQYDEFRREVINAESALRNLVIEQGKMTDIDGNFVRTTKDVKELGNAIDDAGKSTITFGDLLKANVLSDFISDGIRRLADEFTGFIKKGVSLASNLQEVKNVVDVTFGDGAEQIYQWADAAAESYGMSSLAAQNYNGTMGAMLKSMGLTDDAVIKMSTDMVGLAGDMASFYNLDVEQAFEKIRSGISGETEPLKQLGINMSVANLEAYALSQGIETAYEKMSQSEQAILRYNYLMSVTADAQGDFARTSDSFANQQRIMQLNIENLSASLGEKLLPSLNKTFDTANEKLPKLENTVENIGEILGNVTSFALEHHEAILGLASAYLTFNGVMSTGKAIQTGIAAFQDIITKIKQATTAQEVLNAVTSSNAFVLLASAVAAVTVGLIAYSNSLDTVGNRIKDVNKEVEKINENTEKSIADSEAEIAVIEKKAEKYEELREKVNRTAGEEEQLKKLAEELQQYMPEGTQLIDEQTSAYNSLAGSIDSVTESLKKKATIAAYEDEYTNLIKQQIEMQKIINEMEENYDKTGFYVPEVKSQINAKGKSDTAYRNAKKELEDLNKQIEDTDKMLDELYEKNTDVDINYTAGSYLNSDYENQYNADKEAAEQAQKARDEDLQNYVANLDTKLKLRQTSEEQYYSDLKNYLDENKDTESEVWFDQLERYEDYEAKKLDAAKKAAEEDKKIAEETAKKQKELSEKEIEDKISALKEKQELNDDYTEEMMYNEMETIISGLDKESDLYKKYNSEILKGRKKLSDDQAKIIKDGAEKQTKELSDAYDDIKKQKEQVRDELLDIDLMDTAKDKNGNDVDILTDLNAESKKIDKYKSSLSRLEKTGISDSLLEKIKGMNYEDGSRQRFIDTLLGLSPDKLKLYYDDWEKYQAKAASASGNDVSVSEDIENLNEKTSESVHEMFENLAGMTYEDGINAAKNFLQGIYDSMDGAVDPSLIPAILSGNFSVSGSAAGNQGNGSAAGAETQKTVSWNTPITLVFNDKKHTITIGDMIDKGRRTGGNVFDL